jgi:hypothetical protein
VLVVVDLGFEVQGCWLTSEKKRMWGRLEGWSGGAEDQRMQRFEECAVPRRHRRRKPAAAAGDRPEERRNGAVLVAVREEPEKKTTCPSMGCGPRAQRCMRRLTRARNERSPTPIGNKSLLT